MANGSRKINSGRPGIWHSPYAHSHECRMSNAGSRLPQNKRVGDVPTTATTTAARTAMATATTNEINQIS